MADAASGDTDPQSQQFDSQTQPTPDDEFNQRIAWKGQDDDEPPQFVQASSCLEPRERQTDAGYLTPGRDSVAIPAAISQPFGATSGTDSASQAIDTPSYDVGFPYPSF
ncbi:MAG: hypothetical protein IPH26_08760 [Sterolibacteriaceae bacterium]|uniref:Uncharacterized protein n=1 Tax=Candidatus Methylophosphatis roskildensis TaxID=2899263 RepID=A0A9D7E3F2_9PROT|nr:hypothetical protein [Candidatus Methylophosphatis roskildensis]MBK7237573.1 hypothetical protein [Sterolibacteriaceae bacterium]